MLNPISVVETVLLGYLLAVGLQALLTAVYTRAGRGLLMTADEQWSGAYYAITGCAWAMSLAITTFFVLPLSEVNGRKQATEVAVLIAAAVIAVVLYRNRSLNPRLQPLG